MTFPPPGDLNTYKGTILALIESTIVNLNVDYRVTEFFGSEDLRCSTDVKDYLETVTLPPNSKLTRIQKYAFCGCSKLHSFDISSCSELETIDDYAFFYCKSLKTINFPTQKLKTIGEYSFANSGLTSIFIPACVSKIGFSMTNGSFSLASFVMDPNSEVTTLEKYLFAYTLVSEFTIPKNVVNLVDGVFEYSFNINTIKIGAGNTAFKVKKEGLVSFNETVFYYYPLAKIGEYTLPDGIDKLYQTCFIDTKLTKVVLTDSVTNISHWAFSRSETLQTVVFSQNLKQISFYAFYQCTALTNIVLPQSLICIERYAFSGCTFSSIVIPNNVVNIGSSCFTPNSNLMSITLSDKIVDIGGGIFPENEGIKIQFDPNSKLEITDDKFIMDKNKTLIVQFMGKQENFIYNVPDTIETVGDKAFYKKKNLVEFRLSENSKLKTIGYEAFNNCVNLKNINFPSTLTYIGTRCFEYCLGITEVKFKSANLFNPCCAYYFCQNIVTLDLSQSTFTNIAESMFQFCEKLSTIILNDQLTSLSIGTWSFGGCSSLRSFPLTNKITHIGDHAFYRCIALESFVIPPSSTVTNIERYAFCNCISLTSFEFTSSIKTIGPKSFYNTSLVTVTLSENVELLESECFAECGKLTKFNIPENSKLNETGFGLYIFRGDRKLSDIESNSSNLKVATTALFSKEMDKLLIFPPASPVQYFPVPGSVTSIYNGAFVSCENLLSLIISDNSVTSIGNNAFEGCSNLNYINIPMEVVVVGKDAFKGCYNLYCGVDVVNQDPEYLNRLFEYSKLKRGSVRKCRELTCNKKNVPGASIALSVINAGLFIWE